MSRGFRHPQIWHRSSAFAIGTLRKNHKLKNRSDNFYSCKIGHGRPLGPHGRTSECCDSGCSGWRNNASVCPLDRADLDGRIGVGTTNYTGEAMPAAAKVIAAAAGPRHRTH